MALELYNPFAEMIFDRNFCFLTGKLCYDSVSVFPEWLLQHFDLADETFQLMEKEYSMAYKDMRLPCTLEVKQAFDALEDKFITAYNNGFEGISALDDEVIFQWAGKIVYGIIYHELTYERGRVEKTRRNFELSQALIRRFELFHLMLQSVVAPVKFKGNKPWSLVIFPLKYSADIFSYRDDMINLLFTMGVNNFGFIIHFQDNGAIAAKENVLLQQLQGHVLHPVQYEELYARFHYSDYILQYEPKYEIDFIDDQVIIESLPMIPNEDLPLFGRWDNSLFAQLLANYWEVYGLEGEEIMPQQKPLLSFLQNPYTLDFILPENINLPY
ncbi:MAG: hypothetical protein Q4G27_04105 [Flavobacteriaceae bacterium]|nr:hypothetical protein [Flavobacteriaceae bacterium]